MDCSELDTRETWNWGGCLVLHGHNPPTQDNLCYYRKDISADGSLDCAETNSFNFGMLIHPTTGFV
jgi:hypothetical protein